MTPTLLIPIEARCEMQDERAEIAFVVPDDYAYSQGHFPDNPIVPGVAQIGWLVEACRRLGKDGGLIVRRYRFLKRVRPGQSIRAVAQRVEGGFRCEVYADGELASKGQIQSEA